MQELLIIGGGEVTIQSGGVQYSDTVGNFQADGGKMPTDFESINCNLDTGGCWIDGKPFQAVPRYAKNLMKRVAGLCAKRDARLAKAEADRVAQEDAERMAGMTDADRHETALNESKRMRDEAVGAITVDVDGMVFDGDETAQQRMARTVAIVQANGLGMDTETQWVLADSTVATVTVGQLARACLLAGLEQTKLWVKPYEDIE